jgi:hypothetical protein
VEQEVKIICRLKDGVISVTGRTKRTVLHLEESELKKMFPAVGRCVQLDAYISGDGFFFH